MDQPGPADVAVDAQHVIGVLQRQMSDLYLQLAVATARAEQAEAALRQRDT